MDQHDLLCKLKDLAIELGRTPTRLEFTKQIRQSKCIEDFGGYTALCLAAGLEDAGRIQKKLTNKEFFRRDLVTHLAEYEPRPRVSSSGYPRLAIISDIHWPFSNNKLLERFYRHIESHKPDHVIIAGDAWDMYSHSKFPRSQNYFTPEQEEETSRKMNEEFWSEVKRAHGEAKCYQMLGNHDVRPLKRQIENAPTMEHWAKRILTALFTFEGVETVFDHRQELLFDNSIMVHHGYKSQLGAHRDFALMNAIVGHTHRPGIVWRTIRGHQLFEMNCGLAGDPESKGLTYTPQKITEWVAAFGVVDEDGPRNIMV